MEARVSELVIDATWKLPEGHESVRVYSNKREAEACAKWLAAKYRDWLYYIMDKRGAAEVIRYPRK